MIQQLLGRQLEHVAARERSLNVWLALAAAWLLGTTAAVATLYFQYSTGRSAAGAAGAIAVASILAALLLVRRQQAKRLEPRALARRIEGRFPELQSCLLAAVEQRPETPGGRLGYLQASVVGQALEHARRHDWLETIPAGRLRGAIALQSAAFLAFCLSLAAVATGWGRATPETPTAAGPELQLAATGSWSMTVEPGHVEVEKGTSLLVLARIEGRMPLLATLHYRSESGDEVQLTMSPSLEDPVFSARIPLVEAPLEYFVEIEGQESPRYRATVFEYPKLERADVHLVFPDYTGLADKFVQDVRTVSVVEGTKATFQLRVNKRLATAALTPAKGDVEGGSPLVLAASSENPLQYETTVVVDRSRKLRLELIDEAGRKNVKSEQFQIHALPNQPPAIKPIFPARDVEVSALEELHVRASAVDDFGLLRFGLTYALAGQPPVDVVLAEQTAAKQRHESESVIELESLKAEPDQLLSYFWWAEDRDAAGAVRRVQSDMYFAEVRPFEEIFRAGEQPTRGEQQQRNSQNQQGQGQNAQQAQDLAKLQKEIINATWKVIRRESATTLTPGFATDVEQIRQSQESAGEQAQGLAERITDEKSLTHVEEVLEQMREAASQLRTAHESGRRESLTQALDAEQKAYQALLKLRAREHEVVRQQRQQQSPSASSAQQDSARSQQQREQLEQLDLREEENRYETQRTAQERQEESAQEREDRQVLNRLRELAQRQHDLNERLKELQTALDEAASSPEQEEIKRQLQRLQDEQQQILQDTDELQSRLDQPENQERMAEQRQQLDETRDQVRRASEALEKQEVTQAAASGTRAEQQFEDLKEEMRRRSSQRFQEEMREMRQTARDLEKRQQELTEQLGEAPQPEGERPQLRDQETTPQQTPEDLAEQRQRLGELQDRMRDTIEQAEETEPILSERLYESARNLRDQSLDRALQSAERAARLGQRPEAERRSREAQESIAELREGIERAAEGVLGDETEALRRARDELRQLSRELNEEMRRNGAGAEQPGREEGDAQEGRSQEAGAKEDSAKEENAKPGAAKPSEAAGKPGAAEGKPGEKPGPEAADQPSEKPSAKTGPASARGGNGRSEPGAESERPADMPTDAPRQERAPAGQPAAPAEGGRRPGARRESPSLTGGDRLPLDNFDQGGAAPLTGDDFRNWADRLRDVEEMVDDPDLRADAARIRERARAMRAEMKRHSAEPQWNLVREQLTRPLEELEDRVASELLRRSSKKALVPLDRDAAPPQYSEKMRKYYQRLGSGE
ncbi:MAG: DUF4175 family protein [Pirellulales bacterium]